MFAFPNSNGSRGKPGTSVPAGRSWRHSRASRPGPATLHTSTNQVATVLAHKCDITTLSNYLESNPLIFLGFFRAWTTWFTGARPPFSQLLLSLLLSHCRAELANTAASAQHKKVAQSQLLPFFEDLASQQSLRAGQPPIPGRKQHFWVQREKKSLEENSTSGCRANKIPGKNSTCGCRAKKQNPWGSSFVLLGSGLVYW